ncbi:hypothetical protein TCAL_05390 [Tigriopus californicus]|uniref:UDP-glucose 4-epimerase n=1 Tax=Tigriopus californicus TaxID=6832 RepID=A0A553P4S2_TIGCA|nr:UDP-glucose 4-epimerase-like [Tigriopus californicus]TRY72689.1 hypothetical protein TCAL_05390 [Tigriopus californicus]|eukprot:TCALIF_05390-PA protein Name:"Similar to Gale Probable UDP-glucose 4-epimerase (Drosophila melanogaster)" AED:0.15 eAED:0.15 QI:158/1/1/1/0.83/0.71/7/73/356
MKGSGKTILVTGGAGYIATHCIVKLLDQDYDIVALDNFSNSVRGPPGELPPSLSRIQEMTGKTITFYEVDLCDKSSLRNAMGKHLFDCIIHFGAFKSVSNSFVQYLKYYSNNVVGTCNLLEIMNEMKIEKFVYSSSCTVYGVPQFLPLTENHPLGTPTSPYGFTKLVTEEMMRGLSIFNKDLGFILLRYFNPVGAHPSGIIGEDPLGVPGNLMPFIAQVAVGRREKLQIFGQDWPTPDGTCIRDYIHVMDLAEGHVNAVNKVLESGFSGLKAYNLARGNGESVLDIVRAFEKASGKRIPYEIAKRRPGDVAQLFSACDLAKEELDWEAKLTLDDMCRDMWTWQSQNPKGYLTLKKD